MPSKNMNSPLKKTVDFAAGIDSSKSSVPNAIKEDYEEALIPESIDNKEIKVFLNEEELNLYKFPITEIDPNASLHDHSLIIENGVVLAPIVIFHLLDAEIYENVKPNSLSRIERTSSGHSTAITLRRGSPYAYISIRDEAPCSVLLPTAPKLVNNHLYVPLQIIGNALGADVEWKQQALSLNIRDMESPKYPNLRWVLYEFDRFKADFNLKMTVDFMTTSGKKTANLDYKVNGYYNAGNTFSEAALKTSHAYIIPFNTHADYEITKVLNKSDIYDYYIKDLKKQTITKNSIAKMKNGEVLLTDVEYLKIKTEQLLINFGNSDLIKKEPGIILNGLLVDKYTIELNDNSIIAKAFDLRSISSLDTFKPMHEGYSRAGVKKSYVFKAFSMEEYLDKDGRLVKAIIRYSGNTQIESTATHENIRNMENFELSIEANFYNFGRETGIKPGR